ncbi:3-hydroxyacyl-CoA dehydrogenase / enoyl-CoA hydratase / 3-hydroxybutyryl-CoA epimerase [Blastococcus sp. DSM 46786]|uniref:3-hydroxyacyl-CoA dehydrogenase NAD-binding domain-containing protein n=1 Tax=Blastococcus sp. DSM 46786 TaxID=1798227 RepID=UPI0008CCB793|nr:3-hydroxyacyl-CoA dehydrogenase NAD-binding domain-containing protein [Blastococcus sp. DSM 46786]SEL54917.1 3-hydroxyacyl-CoA dehydrogenase / enoyl-CoA hydratase / 3-hydroxybutyryl-CoA epimerase [Blastococcus sp. DSM 46786]
MSNSTIRWEQDADGVVVLTLDDPASSANTMNDAYVASMGETIDRLEREKESVRGVVLTSAKKTFFAGGNLGSLIQATPETRDQVLAQVTLVKRQLRRLETLGVPVAAAINGAALGGGLEIALATHHRVVLDDPKVKLGFPEVTLGLLPGGGGVVRSIRLLGLTTALLELLLQGQQLRPEKALELRLVHELASADELLAKAKQWVLANPDAAQPWDTKGYKVPGGTPSTPSLASSLPAFPANLTKQLKGAPYPAPYAILSAAVESLQVDVDTAFTVEGRYFVDLVVSQVSTNMIQALWFDLNRINGGGSRPVVEETHTARKVGVLGAGMMGAGIAHAFAEAGVDVVLKDVSTEAAEKGKVHVAGLVGKQVQRGRMSQEKADAFLARITPTGDPADLAGCDLIVEAVFEDQALKHRVLSEAEAHALPDALLASNTSTLPITSLAEGVQRQADVVGMHFFSPVDKMPLVELIVGEKTSDTALARAYDAVRQIGKTPIVVADSRGFFTSRVFGTLVMEGAALLAEGLAPMSVERAALQAGFPAGPLTLLDEVTLTLPLKIRDEAARAGATDDHPGVAVLRTLVEHGRTGKSSGQGFFDWQPEKRVWPGLAELFPPSGAVPFRDAQERLLFAMAVETARCLEEQVLRTVEDANIGSIMGIGFPPLYGGVLQYVDQYPGGVAGFVARADELADRYGERFRSPAILLERAVPAGSLRAAAAV